ncbi:MAG: hypothetical protein DMD67_14380 [Gemmatimonadetes bacterium]|nr:MAG: hypothetical protein DMD67_14380 [Gemmatimonadota bacterium]
MTSLGNSGCRCSLVSPGTRHQTPGRSWRGGWNEVPLCGVRPADAVRGASRPGRRYARGGVQVPGVRPRRRLAHIDEQPLETVRGMVSTGKTDAFDDSGERGAGSGPRWSADAQERLARVPGFVRGMVKKIYSDYAKEHGLAEITPAMMDAARSELGLEGM